jgi:hypothetical protein
LRKSFEYEHEYEYEYEYEEEEEEEEEEYRAGYCSEYSMMAYAKNLLLQSYHWPERPEKITTS